MVDVAFLLLTFFILTTTLLTPAAIQVNKPPKGLGTFKAISENKIMTLIPGKDDQIHYYTGISDPIVKTTDYSPKGIRTVIQNFLQYGSNPTAGGEKLNLCASDNSPGCWDPIIVIKPAKKSRFKNMVDILDEMKITDSPKYTLAQITETDSLILVSANISLQ